jgi:D-cysteine desulfhydrase
MAAEELLQKDPQSADARECAALARSELRKLYASRLGDLRRIPVHTLRTETPRDAEVRAVWDKVDGVRSMQDLIDSGATSTLDLLRVLYELLLEGRIELRALSLGSMSRIHLVHGPTPLIRLPRLSDQLAVDLWIKRDDADGGVEAGNKLRKLEYLVGDALDRGCDTLITCGALQSNHCRATAAIAARFGLSCVLMLRSNDISAPLPLTGNVLLMRVLGADIHLITPAQYRDRDSLLQATADTLRRTGKKPYVIPEGGSNGLGSLGYVEAMREVRVQLDLGIADGKPFDMIVHACGSGGTAAGVALGAARSNVAAEVRAVAVCDDVAYFQRVIDRIIGEARALSPELKDCARVVIDDSAKGPAYGATTHEQRAFLIDVARRHGLVLDPVYTGKALFGLAQAIHRDGSLVGKRVLFLHTGGLPGLLAQGDLFADELA